MKYNADHKRILAGMLDGLIFSIEEILLLALAVFVVKNTSIDYLPGILLAWIVAIVTVDLAMHAVIPARYNGKSIGKAVSGLQIVSASGKVPSILRLVGRRAVFDLASFIGGVLPLIAILITEKRQGIHDLIAGTFVIEQGKAHSGKRLLLYFIALFVALVMAIILLIWAMTLPNRTPAINPDNGLGFGDSNEALPDDYLPTETPAGDSITEGSDFEIIHRGVSSDNILKLSGTSLEIPGAVYAKWSSDKQFLMFNRTELEGCGSGFCNENAGNLWIVNADATGLRQLLDYPAASMIDYASNGQKIGFAVLDKVGTISTDGSGLNYIYEFEQIPIPGDVIYVPRVDELSESSFQVTFLDLEGNETVKVFEY